MARQIAPSPLKGMLVHCKVFTSILSGYERCSYLMVSVLASGLSSPASSLAGNILLCSWARHFTLTVPLSTQVYKWIQANLMLEVTLWWTSIPSKGRVEILLVSPCCWNQWQALAWWATWFPSRESAQWMDYSKNSNQDHKIQSEVRLISGAHNTSLTLTQSKEEASWGSYYICGMLQQNLENQV